MKLQIVEKTFSKHYNNINSDIDNFLNSINSKDDLGIELKSNILKVRVKNSDKNKGKSAEYRLISYLAIVGTHTPVIHSKAPFAGSRAIRGNPNISE